MTLSTVRRRNALPPRPQARSGPGKGFRADIEGLRAVAVLLVVAFHAGLPAIHGGYVGVDVFFVLSGFLITGMLIDEVTRSGTISIATFYARRIRRLLPLSALVVTCTAVAAIFLAPPLTQSDVAGDLRSASLYFANWHFAAGLTDYMAVGVDKSPVLHYWSLAVEEQFYVIWPMIILALIWLGRRVRGGRELPPAHLVRWIGRAIGIIFFLSLVWSALSSESSGPWAYYGLHTRAWELAAGGALAVSRSRLPVKSRMMREVAGWVGLLAVLASALWLSAATVFPGTAALLPVGGTVLLVAAGAGERQVSAPLLLSNPVFRYVGRISYAWYLWHWPCLVLLKALPEGSPTPSHRRVFLAIVLSLALSALSHRYVEDPARRSRWLSVVRHRSLALGVVLTMVSLLASLALAAASQHAASDARHAGGLTMTPAQARADKVQGVKGCHVSFASTTAQTPKECVFGDANGKESIVLIGDSHAQHWFPAMETVARAKGWRLYLWSKNTCTVNETDLYLDVYKRPYPECASWRHSMLDQLDKLGHVDHIIVARSWKYQNYSMKNGTRITDQALLAKAWQAGAAADLHRLSAVSDDIVLLRDGPRAPQNIPTCLSEHPSNVSACGFDRRSHTHLDSTLYDAEERAVAGLAAAGLKDIRLVDPTSLFCGTGNRCPAVSDRGVIIYRDDNHMTQTFSRSLADRLSKVLRLD